MAARRHGAKRLGSLFTEQRYCDARCVRSPRWGCGRAPQTDLASTFNYGDQGDVRDTAAEIDGIAYGCSGSGYRSVSLRFGGEHGNARVQGSRRLALVICVHGHGVAFNSGCEVQGIE